MLERRVDEARKRLQLLLDPAPKANDAAAWTNDQESARHVLRRTCFERWQLYVDAKTGALPRGTLSRYRRIQRDLDREDGTWGVARGHGRALVAVSESTRRRARVVVAPPKPRPPSREKAGAATRAAALARAGERYRANSAKRRQKAEARAGIRTSPKPSR